MTRCTIPTFVNVFAGNLFIRLIYIYIYIYTNMKPYKNLNLKTIRGRLWRSKNFYKNGKNVGMAQNGQKQEGMSCGEVFAVCVVSTHKGIAPYPYIWQHSASCATHCMVT